MKSIYAIAFLLLLNFTYAFSQCPAGQVQVSIDIHSDDYGYEGYWQLVPSGNPCGTGTIFSGGNNLVGCNGGGAQSVPSGGGYPNQSMISEGPWCLDSGATYDIIFVDDYGDGGLIFTVNINGYPIYSGLTGTGNNAGTRIPFVVQPAYSHDIACAKVTLPSYVSPGNISISGEFMNRGTTPVTSIDVNYSIDNGTVYTSSVSGLSILPFESFNAASTNTWIPSLTGQNTIKMWASNINGTNDLDITNDTATKTINVGPATPNYIDDYIGASPVLTVIGNIADGIDVPRDLDFHPVLTRYELWVILKSTENSGGKTVKFTNAGQPGQTSLLQQDGNAWHFMSLPTGIAFSDNENFSTSPGVYDANHGSGTPFTGPTLWSSDPLIYAQPSGGNGSHMDMLHQSPYAMGICHEVDNAFWVYDANENDIVRYDFVKDHGPGNSDHSDGIIRRFGGLGLMGESTHHVPSHLILDKETNMLYIVDTGNDRILRMDITSGTFLNNLSPYEPTAEYSSWGNVTFNSFADSGLTTPSGIDLIGNRLIVSDFATGDIIIYDKSASTGVELGRIVTGTPGIMGVKIGPDGKIWYVNATTNEVVRIDGITAGLNPVSSTTELNTYPNPATSRIYISANAKFDVADLMIYDISGKIVDCDFTQVNDHNVSVNIDALSKGVYFAVVKNDKQSLTTRFVKK